MTSHKIHYVNFLNQRQDWVIGPIRSKVYARFGLSGAAYAAFQSPVSVGVPESAAWQVEHVPSNWP